MHEYTEHQCRNFTVSCVAMSHLCAMVLSVIILFNVSAAFYIF